MASQFHRNPQDFALEGRAGRPAKPPLPSSWFLALVFGFPYKALKHGGSFYEFLSSRSDSRSFCPIGSPFSLGTASAQGGAEERAGQRQSCWELLPRHERAGIPAGEGTGAGLGLGTARQPGRGIREAAGFTEGSKSNVSLFFFFFPLDSVWARPVRAEKSRACAAGGVKLFGSSSLTHLLINLLILFLCR